MEKIGVIAGNNDLPYIMINEARKKGVSEIYVVAFPNITRPEIETIANDVCYTSVGQFGKLISYFKNKNIKHIFMIGQIPPKLIFKKIRFDARGLKLFKKLYNKGADHVFGIIAHEMQKENLVLQDSTLFLDNLLSGEGILTKKKPSKKQEQDINLGKKIARQIAYLDVGQTVVIKDGAVLAIEAFEGTDATIERGAQLGGDGIVVVKVSSPEQDMRYDVPCAGMQTLNLLLSLRASVLALEAGRSLLLHKDEMIKKANSAGLIITGIK